MFLYSGVNLEIISSTWLLASRTSRWTISAAKLETAIPRVCNNFREAYLGQRAGKHL
jgi:hypothetical protein